MSDPRAGAARCTAIVLAAGRGVRFGQGLAKQFVLLRDRPLLVWSLGAFDACGAIDRIVVVVPRDDVAQAEALLERYRPAKPVRLCAGGAERTDSMRSGLAQLEPTAEWAAIHDAARPLVTADLVERVFRAAFETGAALAALPAHDTVKLAGSGGCGTEGRVDRCVDRCVDRTLARDTIYLAQTPQVFRVALLREALSAWEAGGRPPVTDDAQLVEMLGRPVQLVPGEPRNFKITVSEDLMHAQRLLAEDAMPMPTPLPVPRSGIGFDAHRLVPGRRLVLGGIDLAHELGLAGHSDADVLTHAIMDALLGAACLGDIGQHFPPGDEAFRGAESVRLLGRVGELLRERGYRVGNVDSVVACERPRLAPHVPAMRARLAAALGVREDQVSVKATTTERMGFTGREEGIAAYATAMIAAVGSAEVHGEDLTERAGGGDAL